MTEREDKALVVYDGECIFCQNYTRLIRLRDSVGAVELLDARSGDPRVVAYQRQGYDLNEGMLFVHCGVVHHGSDAVHALAVLSSSSNLFSSLNRRVLSTRVTARLFYPVLKAARRLTLLLRGRGLIARPDDLA